MTVPSWDNLLEIYNLTNAKEANPITDLQRLEVRVEPIFFLLYYFETYLF